MWTFCESFQLSESGETVQTEGLGTRQLHMRVTKSVVVLIPSGGWFFYPSSAKEEAAPTRRCTRTRNANVVNNRKRSAVGIQAAHLGGRGAHTYAILLTNRSGQCSRLIARCPHPLPTPLSSRRWFNHNLTFHARSHFFRLLFLMIHIPFT